MASTKATPSRKKTPAEDSKPTASVTSFAPSAVIAREEEIRRRAYEFYEARGRQDGAAEEDWLRAEEEVIHTNGKRTA
jgi:hypothetical protein